MREARSVPCCVVDDHSDVVPFIIACVRAKRLSLGAALLHFDAHPDLSLPSSYRGSASSWRARTLFEDLLSHNEGCIAEWILPLVYCGIIGQQVTWIRSPWSQQIPDGTYSFVIGDSREGGTDSSAVSLLEPYYVSEGDALKEELIENGKPCVLKVGSTVDLAVHGEEGYILDVCLDFFVTANPFLERITTALGTAQHVLPHLIDMYRSVYEQCRGRESGCNRALRAVEYAVLHGTRSAEGGAIDDAVETAMGRFLVSLDLGGQPISAEAGALIIAAKYLLLLPDHQPASDKELEEDFARFEEELSKLRSLPSLITIARSADDGYTPADRVEHVQQRVLSALRSFLSGFGADIEQHDLTQDALERSRVLFLNRDAKRYCVSQDIDIDVVKKSSRA